MAEGVRFELTRGAKPPAGFQDRCLKPLGHPSILFFSHLPRDGYYLLLGLLMFC
jgi:hypothetical protein